MLIPAERRNRIHEILQLEGAVRVSQLSELLGVSDITIRRDLELMEENGELERTHGGAIQNRRIDLEPPYSEKHRARPAEKRAIGLAAAALVEDGDTLLIHSGSTTLHIFRHLAIKKNLHVITSNMSAFLELQNSSVDLQMIGGTYRRQSNSLVGPLAISTLRQVVARKCFIGVDGVSLKYGMTTPNIQEAEVAQAMIERTHGEVIVVADHTKFGVVADYLTAPLEKINTLVTSTGVNLEFVEDLRAMGIRVVTAEIPVG
jgi:DeoR/GlpR family transcriptional regulator of sugar metabolism